MFIFNQITLGFFLNSIQILVHDKKEYKLFVSRHAPARRDDWVVND